MAELRSAHALVRTATMVAPPDHMRGDIAAQHVRLTKSPTPALRLRLFSVSSLRAGNRAGHSTLRVAIAHHAEP